MTLTVASLFDGIGGFPLAFERAGGTTVATVEIDPEAAAISRRHFPHARQFDDVTKVSGDHLRAVGFVPDRGSLTSGWPCQPATLAELDTLLLRTRERGWAAEQGDVMADYSSVGTAALDHKGYPIAAIGVTFRSGITDDAVDALGATVVTTAAALGARALGRA